MSNQRDRSTADAIEALSVVPGSRPFPILSEFEHATNTDWRGAVIPWGLIAPHEAQAAKNHYQSLDTLARRGGLGRSEACAVIEDREWRNMPAREAHSALAAHVAAFNANK